MGTFWIENCNLQHQRHQRAAAEPANVVGDSAAGHGVPAGTQGDTRGVPDRWGSCGRLWCCLARRAGMEWRTILARDAEPILIRDALPGDPDDHQSRYIEAAVNGVFDCVAVSAERQSAARIRNSHKSSTGSIGCSITRPVCFTTMCRRF